jgi:hypothetical protein
VAFSLQVALAENEPTAGASSVGARPRGKQWSMRIENSLRRRLGLVLLCLSCGGPLRYETKSTAQVPGADARIEANVNEEQRQTQLTVQITNLPPPDRVEASSQHYVAWYRRGPESVWTRVAALAYEADSREANLQGSVPEVKFMLEITAEPTPDVAAPSPNVVFAQGIGG